MFHSINYTVTAAIILTVAAFAASPDSANAQGWKGFTPNQNYARSIPQIRMPAFTMRQTPNTYSHVSPSQPSSKSSTGRPSTPGISRFKWRPSLPTPPVTKPFDPYAAHRKTMNQVKTTRNGQILRNQQGVQNIQDFTNQLMYQNHVDHQNRMFQNQMMIQPPMMSQPSYGQYPASPW